MSISYEGIDLTFRPQARLFPMSAEKLVLSRVKGAWRREVLEVAVEEDRLNEVDPFFTQVSLSNEERLARSAVHPCFMGGEYLPDFEEDEVEVARIELASVTADVISVRVRKGDKGFHYRVVDEYENECLAEPTEIVADEPLCLLDFGQFVCNAANLADIVSFNEFEDSEAARAFISGTSMFYPQFGMFVSRTIKHQLQTAAKDYSGR